MKILVVNCGSSSLKYQLIDMDNEQWIAKGVCERIKVDGTIKGSTADGRSFENDNAPMNDHTQAFSYVMKALTQGECKVIDDISEIDAVGHRVVQGGWLFNKAELVDDSVVEGIRELCDLAPLHNPAHIQGIEGCFSVFGKDVPQVCVFDNAYHSTMPDEAKVFGVPYELTEKYHCIRYGAHGTSHKYIAAEVARMMGRDDLKLVSCHIGNGASITAIENGVVRDTSMGLTPLDGFIMGTRSGSLDPSVVTYLQEKEGWSPKETSEILNKKFGVLGISGVSSDERDIQKAVTEGNERALLSRKIQRYQIRKFIGSYVAALDGVDAIAFAAGIAENTPSLREDVCNHLSFLGIKIDEAVNNATFGETKKISTDDSKVAVFVIATNEELMIARETKQIVEKL
ncbi:MAG: acetate kinase [Clostridia bacterium]|nr:acetate kinase [Clostridia bacterium]